MKLYFVTINIRENDELNDNYKRYTNVCTTIKKALECAKHKAWIYEFKPSDYRKKWIKNTYRNIWCRYYNKGYIVIEEKYTWEKPWD